MKFMTVEVDGMALRLPEDAGRAVIAARRHAEDVAAELGGKARGQALTRALRLAFMAGVAWSRLQSPKT